MIAAVPEAASARRTQLPNGLVLCSEFVPGVRSVAVGAWVRSASLHEPPGQMGSSHLLEHLVFKGTTTRSAQDIALALESRGGSLDAYTGREHTVFQAHCLDRDLHVAADLLRDLLFSPALRDEDLALERQVVLDEIALVDDTPDDLVFEEHNVALWGAHPFGYSILGTRESVASMSVDTLRELHVTAYRPGNVVVSAGGNLEHEAFVGAMLAAGWGDLQGAAPPTRAIPEPVPEPPREVRIPRELQQSHIVMGSTTIPVGNPTRHAFLVVSALFGGGMGSRLFQRVREELGLAYAVYGFSSLYAAVGVHGVYVGTGPDTVASARAAVVDELKRLVDDGIPEDELELGRQQCIGQYLLSLESVGARMNRAAGRELYGEPYRTEDEVIALFQSVTAADALEVARAWFAPDRQTTVVLGP